MITVDQQALVRALSTAAATTNKATTTPILAGLLIQAAHGTLSIVGSDLFTTTRATCECDGALKALVAPGEIVDRVKALPPGPVRIEASDTALTISSGHRKFKLHTMRADDFPAVHADTAGGESINAKDLATALSRVSVAMSHDSTRGIYGLLFAGDELHATDGHRLAIVPSPTAVKCRIGAESAATLVKFCDGSESVKMELRGTRLHITRSDATMSTAVLDASAFPEIRNALINMPDARQVAVDRQSLAESLRAIQNSTHKETRAVQFDFAEGAVQLRALGGDRGEGEDVVQCEVAKAFKFRCDVGYLTAALSATDAKEASIFFWDEWAPLVVKGSTTIHGVAGLR